MQKRIAILIAILLLVGCATPSQESNKLTLGLVQSTVEKGANQTEITKVLGAPNIISIDKQGRETWTYDRISRDNEAQSFGWWAIFAGGNKSATSASSRSLTVVITFDENKNVIDYASQSLEF
ncbi:MAG: hypothetical protein QF842_00230 [Candidatus Marinimicrobia bacterium]|jgi:outer membrane protein assembly factor BamE (lipoprotein component of BamABCDE complex)|nr:hypothetical protein [Candidatus Neomarinimicrobiota bacterium]MDP6611380.1 hypothetical protein [Candidatus Neomarinimicrobiota bacterium]|tara:strand:- start:28 stop:396 length:369 start_codon:yes stop_codon:yes gene_type:complete